MLVTILTVEKLTILSKIPSITIPLHGMRGEGKVAVVDGDYDGEYFSHYRWYVLASGYVVRAEKANGNTRYIFLHREVARTPKGLDTDHVNHDKLDNRSCNLRWATKAQNQANNRFKSSKRQYRGVLQHRYKRIKNGKLYYYVSPTFYAVCSGKKIGKFKTAEAAAKAYDSVSRELFGEFATLNFPNE